MKNYGRDLFLLIAVLLLTSGTAFSQAAPNYVTYQGQLFDATGTPLSGSFTIRFTIYSSEWGPDTVWQEWHSVEVQNGLFTVLLGDGFPSAPLAFGYFDSPDRWLGIKIGNDPEISPRTRMSSVPYAHRVGSISGAVGGTILGDLSIEPYIKGANVGDLGNLIVAGKIGVGTATPQTALDVNGIVKMTGLQLPTGATEGLLLTSDANGVGTWRALSGASLHHGSLTGLADDDHSQYLLANGTRSLSGNLNSGNWKITALAAGTMNGDAVRFEQAVKTGDAAGGDLVGSYPSPQISTNAVGSSEIQDGSVSSADIASSTIVDADVSPTAAIAVSKVSGTAVNLSSTQTITGVKTFNNTVSFFDDVMTVANDKVYVGDYLGGSDDVMAVQRFYNSSSFLTGIRVNLENAGTGFLGGLNLDVNSTHATSTAAVLQGAYIRARSSSTSLTSDIKGVYSSARGNSSSYGGTTTGIEAVAEYGHHAYGLYASASGASTNIGVYAHATGSGYSGYFLGDVSVVGNLSKSGGAFKIDHPLDPENKYLQHSFVESPDMMNIYNGNVITDMNGEAVVSLPSYFDALNQDFRYQLTVIGQFSQAIVARKIVGNQFTIKTDKPNVEVSWQVTGIRKDAWAINNRIQVEVDKPPDQRGLYAHPEVFNMPPERSVEYKHSQRANDASIPKSEN